MALEDLRLGGHITELGTIRVNIAPMIGDTEAQTAMISVDVLRFCLFLGSMNMYMRIRETMNEEGGICIDLQVATLEGVVAQITVGTLTELVASISVIRANLREQLEKKAAC